MGEDSGANKTSTRRSFIKKVIIEQVCLSAVTSIAFYLQDYATPVRRGFFCEDLSIRYPVKKETIPMWLLALICIGTTMIFMFAVEFRKWMSSPNKSKEGLPLSKNFTLPIPMRYLEISTHFIFGLAYTFIITNIIKVSVGRLRPVFFDVCRPLVDGYPIDCKPSNRYRYIDDYVCANPEQVVRGSRMSFLSGHASVAFFCMIYLMCYLQVRTRWNSNLKQLVQLCMITIAVYISSTRIIDNKHHWSDVLAGCALGVIGALISIYYVSDLLKPEVDKAATQDVETAAEANEETNELKERNEQTEVEETQSPV